MIFQACECQSYKGRSCVGKGVGVDDAYGRHVPMRVLWDREDKARAARRGWGGHRARSRFVEFANPITDNSTSSPRRIFGLSRDDGIPSFGRRLFIWSRRPS